MSDSGPIPEQGEFTRKLLNQWLERMVDPVMPSMEEIHSIVNRLRKVVLEYDDTCPVILAKSPVEAWFLTCQIVNFNTVDNLIYGSTKETVTQILNKEPDEESRKQLNDVLSTFIWPFFSGNFLCGYISWLESMLSKGAEIAEDMWSIYKDTFRVGFLYPLPLATVVSEKPKILKFVDDVLHCETGPAVKYSDGISIYCIRSVVVPDWLVETPADELDVSRVIALENVEQRREGIRKIGIERCRSALGWKVIDSSGTYELGTVQVDPRSTRIYLLMENPSLPGVYHMEAVHPSCSTVQEALNWRRYGDRSKDWSPDVLT